MRTLGRNEPLVLVMVGLPARGKTFLARKLARYLMWLGREAKVFNVGNYRRERVGSAQPASFFDPDNPVGFQQRQGLALDALHDLMTWVREGEGAGGRIAIYDATNATHQRRALVTSELSRGGLAPIFVESVCNDAALVEANIRETKLSMPDYAGVEAGDAVADFRARIAHYERSYEPCDEADGSWVKLVDVGRQVVSNGINGYLPTKIVSFLTNLHITERTIALVRHGESSFNVANRVGGDPALTARGRAFAQRFAAFASERFEAPPHVWTSTLTRTIETASYLSWPSVPLKNLDEIDAGLFDGWTYDEIEAKQPDEAQARGVNKLSYRYPRGESYEDVISRLDPVIFELERQRDPVIVVSHQAVLRCLYGYFVGKPPAACPHLKVPLHTVITLRPKAYGAHEERFPL